ncbi:PP2C family protein-serine/threonine phosphatase [Hyphomicrobium sp.]|uniref:PP2C family protein-serine/threonine phosphatase n=1 Tax=Hyphomicrobium sp. TaxID=82 RepID=UPI002E356916|nr:protein phosphatase 2C domain-containing protein [Hyphomicrobium sp.]HEX2839718.1 protein phosphatase 2C domain-containing protein [Hyphomicrobium sp.]
MTWRVAGAARATIGTRAKQEDAFAIWPSAAHPAAQDGEGVLAVVADGMGGHAGGEVAGRLACETFISAFSGRHGAAGDRLHTALGASNSAIAARASETAGLRGMGCTLVGAWIDGAGLRWVSVGDSLLLLFRAPDVLRLNADHSLGAFLDDQARRGKMSAGEAASNPYRNALRSALTGKKIEILDLQGDPYPLAAGDWLILASDGIATLAGDEIGDIVYANRDGAAGEMAERLIAAVEAKRDPDQDNATVVVLKIEDDATATATDESPTRILKLTTPPATGSGLESTQRVRHTPAAYQLFRRYRSWILGIGMGLMFLIGWMLRAALG